MKKIILILLGIVLLLIFSTSALVADDIDADKNIGMAPLTVHFKLSAKLWSYFQEWSFGDGVEIKERNPVHTFTKPGNYPIKVVYRNADGRFEILKEDFITVYPPSGLAPLKLVRGSATWPGEDWTNAVDGDIYEIDGTVTTVSNPASAIFEFSDGQLKKILNIRLLTESGINNRWHQVQQAKIETSQSGLDDNDFEPLGELMLTSNGWTALAVDSVEARYIKISLNKPNLNQKQFAELEVYTVFSLVDSVNSTITATMPQAANGVEKSIIELRLKDQTGQIVSGKTLSDIVLHITGSENFVNDFQELEPGLYTFHLTSLAAEEKIITAFVNGVPVAYTDVFQNERARTVFTQPAVEHAQFRIVDSSQTWPGEGWNKAFDGKHEGRSSYVSATGNPPFVLLEFKDRNIQWINQIRVKTAANYDSEPKRHWAKEITLLVSTSEMDDEDFTEVLTTPIKNGDWENFYFPAVAAKYIKFIIKQPQGEKWRQIAELQIFTVAAPTPVELAVFETKVNQNSVELTWVTLSESNNLGFEIQRRVNHKGFETVGFVKGQGTTNHIHTYHFTDLDLPPAEYYYRLKQIDLDGTFALSEEKSANLSAPKKFELIQNYPNPFNPQTTIQYRVGEAGDVRLSIKNILGQEIQQLVNKFHEAGIYEVVWSGTDLNDNPAASGIYLYVIESKNFQAQKRMLLIR